MRVTPELMEECADWIAAQMEEESMFVDPMLVQQILEHEWANETRIPEITHEQAVAAILQRLVDAGVQGAPDSIDQRLILTVLQWEDDFLSLAGRTRVR
jgi:hypothetical protein